MSTKKNQNKTIKKFFFNFRINEVERKNLNEISKKLGFVSLSEFIRTAIRDVIKRFKDEQ